MKQKLEPCPFCGKVPQSIDRDNVTELKFYSYRIRCRLCGIPTVRRKTASGAIRAWNRRKLAALSMLCALFYILPASAETIKVRTIFVQHDEAVSLEYLKTVQEKVRDVYKSQLGISLRFSTRMDSRIDHSIYRHVDARLDEFWAYSKILKQNPRYVRVVAVPPYWGSDGRSYGAGYSLWFSTTVVRATERTTGLSRFNSDWVSMAHELCHSIAYNTGRFCAHDDRYPNIMHSNAMAYADFGLEFTAKTKAALKIKVLK